MRLVVRALIVLLLLISTPSHSQNVEEYGTIILQFKSKSTRLKKCARSQLDSLAMQVRSDTSKWVIISVFYGGHCKGCGARSWDRVLNVQNYLIKKGIRIDHVLSKLEENIERDKAKVSISPLDPYFSTPPPPYPAKKKMNG